VRVQDNELKFNVFEALQHPKDNQQCFMMDVIDELCLMELKQLSKENSLEKALINSYSEFNEEEEKEIERCLDDLDATKELPTKKVQMER
jgi:hypothetical protein